MKPACCAPAFIFLRMLTKTVGYDKLFAVLRDTRKGDCIRQRLHSSPSSGGEYMQYVTYENLFSFTLVIIELIAIFVAILAYIKK